MRHGRFKRIMRQIMRLLVSSALILPTCAPSAVPADWDTVALTVTFDARAPEPVANFTAASGPFEGTIDLAWTAPHEDGATGGKVTRYVVKYATFSVAGLAGDTTAWWNHPSTAVGLDIPSFQVRNPGSAESNFLQGLTPGVTCYFGIRSYDDASAVSDFDLNMYGTQAKAVATDLKPETPMNFERTALSSTSVTVAWDDMTNSMGYADFDRYRLYRSVDPSTPVLLTTTTAVQFTDRSVIADTTYYYWLDAIDLGPLALASDLTPVIQVYVPLPLPPQDLIIPRPPAGVKLKITNNRPELRWSRVTRNMDGSNFDDRHGYRIYRSNNPYTGWVSIGFVPGNTDDECAWTDVALGSLFMGEVYYYKVVAVDTMNNESGDSMLCDTTARLNVIAVSGDQQALVAVPKSLSGVLYKGAQVDDDVIIRVQNRTDQSVPDAITVYEWTAEKADSGERVPNFQFGKAQAEIAVKYELAVNSLKQAGKLADIPITRENLCLFWYNGLEWVKLDSTIEENALTTLSSRLGKYMVKLSRRAPGFALTKVYPQIFTPDGDGKNDHVEFQFENPLDGNAYGRIYDLRGALVGELRKGQNTNALIWDGRMTNGDIAPPNVYIYQIETTGAETKKINGIIILAK